MKAFIENNTIFTTSDNSLVPKNAIAIDVPEGTLPQDVIFQSGVLRLKIEVEKEEDRKAQTREEAKQELARTDMELIRVIEDIIDVLWIADKLPVGAKNKITKRKDIRKILS